MPALVRSLQQQNQQLMQAITQQNSDYQQLTRYYHAGLTQTEMAKLLNSTAETVRKKLRAMNTLGLITYQPHALLSHSGAKGGTTKPLNVDEKRRICQLYQQGYKSGQISEQVGRSSTSVQKVLKAYRAQTGGNA